MLEPEPLVDVGGATVEREGWRLRLGEHLHCARGELDPARRELGVDRSFGSGAHVAGDPHHVLGPQPRRAGTTGRLGVDHDLDEPGRVADVDEQHAAVVAVVRDPATDDHRRTDVVDVERAALVGPHHGRDPLARS